MIGWDEVLQPDTPRDVVIQSWRGPTGLAAAARQGNRVMLSNGYYIDLNQPAAQHYLVDPFGGEGASLTAEQKARVLGGEATMWSEFVTRMLTAASGRAPLRLRSASGLRRMSAMWTRCIGGWRSFRNSWTTRVSNTIHSR